MAWSGADALSLLRVCLAFPAAYWIRGDAWEEAALVFAVAAISDLADGPLARRGGSPRPRGALLDHGADAIFVVLCLGALATKALVSALLPVLVLLAFAQYVWDSGVHRGGALRGHAIGKINGIAYYLLVGAMIVAEGWIPAASGALSGVALGLIGTTAFSMSQRARLRRRE